MNVVFFGPPGAGKGTIAGKVSDRTGLPHLSTGEMFREAIRLQTDLGNQVQKIIEAGALVPDEITIAIVKERLEGDDTRRGVLLDGFPRTIAQARALDGLRTIDLVINLQAADEVIVRRLSGRRVCSACGEIHHIEFIPPKREGVCDACGGELYQRKDDTVEAITHRLEVYREKTETLIAYYRDRGVMVDIDGNPDAETVCSSVCAALGLS